jgi:hypothetical protein
MTHSFKLSRRIARLRAPVFTAFILSLVGCNDADSFNPGTTTSPETTSLESPATSIGASSGLTSSTTAQASCLAQAGPLLTLSGAQQRYDLRKSKSANLKVDARNASWTGAGEFPVLAGNALTGGLCWAGGTIQGLWSAGTSWSAYHSTAGMVLASPGFTLEDVQVRNYGDAIRVLDYTDNWTMRGIHVQGAHDDCVENDRLYGGLIDDALFEGCYVFLSERPGSGVEIPVDGRSKTVTIQNTLVYLQPMPTVYRGTAPGTGPLFKWSALGSKLVINNTIFRIDQKPNHGELNLPPGLGSCSNNTIVWLGGGAYPAPLPSCFRVVTDKSVWERAVADWKARHL